MADNRAGWPWYSRHRNSCLIGAVTIKTIESTPQSPRFFRFGNHGPALIGLVTGAFVTYFFTRSALPRRSCKARS